MPLAHHDIVCHLKSTTHCTTCVVGSSGETAALGRGARRHCGLRRCRPRDPSVGRLLPRRSRPGLLRPIAARSADRANILHRFVDPARSGSSVSCFGGNLDFRRAEVQVASTSSNRQGRARRHVRERTCWGWRARPRRRRPPRHRRRRATGAGVREELDKLRKEFEAIRDAYGARLAALESKLTAIGAPAAPEAPAQAAAAPRARRRAGRGPGPGGCGRRRRTTGALPVYGNAGAMSKIFNPTWRSSATSSAPRARTPSIRSRRSR